MGFHGWRREDARGHRGPLLDVFQAGFQGPEGPCYLRVRALHEFGWGGGSVLSHISESRCGAPMLVPELGEQVLRFPTPATKTGRWGPRFA